MYMNHKELVDNVSANLIKKGGKLESRKSWLAMRNYLQKVHTNSFSILFQLRIITILKFNKSSKNI